MENQFQSLFFHIPLMLCISSAFIHSTRTLCLRQLVLRPVPPIRNGRMHTSRPLPSRSTQKTQFHHDCDSIIWQIMDDDYFTVNTNFSVWADRASPLTISTYFIAIYWCCCCLPWFQVVPLYSVNVWLNITDKRSSRHIALEIHWVFMVARLRADRAQSIASIASKTEET